MKTVRGIALLSVLALTGSAAAPAAAVPAEPTRVGIYAAMSDAEFADVEARLCGHFAAGYSVEDVARVQADLFGPEAGAQMRAVAESVKATGC